MTHIKFRVKSYHAFLKGAIISFLRKNCPIFLKLGVILDEPTNALDPLLKKDIISLIKYFKKYKKCIIIISHDKDIYSIFDENISV